MAPLGRSAFRSLLRELDATEFEQFVADLWRARGWDVDVVTDHVLVVTHADRDTTQTLAIESGSRWVEQRSVSPSLGYDIDAVVVDVDVSCVRFPDNLAGSDVAVIDANELYDLALYAIDRDVCDDLVRTYFDRSAPVAEVDPPSLSDESPPDSSTHSVRRIESTTGHTPSVREAAEILSIRRWKRVIAGAGLVLVVIVAGMLGGVADSGQPLGTGKPSSSPTSVPTTTPIATSTTDQAFHVEMTNASTDAASTSVMADVRSARDEDRAPPTIRGPFPPGMNESGITNPYVLADAHETALTNRSYTWLLTYREVVDGRPTATARETVRVEGPTVYRSTVREVGGLRTYPNALGDFSTYANGSVRYEYNPDDPDARYRTCTMGEYSREQDRFANRAETNLEYFLTVEETTITDAFERDGTRFYWVVFANDPWPGVQNTVGSALIDSTGIVHALYRNYYHAVREEATITMTFRYTDIGTTTVKSPTWHSAAKNATLDCDELGDRIESPPE